jgi:hypothetical protein
MTKLSAKQVLEIIAAGIAAYAAYKILFKKEKPITAVKEAVKETVTAPVVATKKLARFIKGSVEAKEHMKKLSAMRKPKGHKGHKTKRGLHQDQVMISKESWEKTYRKDHPKA